MATEKIDYGKDLSIDKYTLDEEWVKQAHLYNEWSVLLAEAELERDKAGDNISLVKAELDLDVRSDPSKYGLAKTTEESVKSVVLTNVKYKNALDDYNQKKYNYRIIQSAIESLNHKKYALDNLVKLYLSEYYLKDAPPPMERTTADELNNDPKLKDRLKKRVTRDS